MVLVVFYLENLNFYPRSPCGERRFLPRSLALIIIFLSTLSLRRATLKQFVVGDVMGISIHALLAESDNGGNHYSYIREYFYPRSPCGERHLKHFVVGDVMGISIHALLAESDRTVAEVGCMYYISIHALLAESD